MSWRYGAFELDPTIPPEGVDPRAYLEGKYDPAAADAIQRRLRSAAAADGLPLIDFSDMRVRPNTFAAHRLQTEALAQGRTAQQALADGLFAAYWAEGRDIGDHAVLTDVAAACGMRGARVRDVLTSDEHAAAVRAEEGEAQRLGIHAVPAFVFDLRLAVSGAQPAEVLAGAVRQALAAAG